MGCRPQDFLTKAARDVILYPATDQSTPLSHSTINRKQNHPCLLTVGDDDGDFTPSGSSRASRQHEAAPELCQLSLVKPEDFLDGDKEKEHVETLASWLFITWYEEQYG